MSLFLLFLASASRLHSILLCLRTPRCNRRIHHCIADSRLCWLRLLGLRSNWSLCYALKVKRDCCWIVNVSNDICSNGTTHAYAGRECLTAFPLFLLLLGHLRVLPCQSIKVSWSAENVSLHAFSLLWYWLRVLLEEVQSFSFSLRNERHGCEFIVPFF